MKCDVYLRKEFYANVVLSSGTTMFQEIVERMTNEPTALAPYTTTIKAVAPTRLLHQSESIRYGLEDLSCLPSKFQQTWTSKDGFDESGPSIVHRKSCSEQQFVWMLIQLLRFIVFRLSLKKKTALPS